MKRFLNAIILLSFIGCDNNATLSPDRDDSISHARDSVAGFDSIFNSDSLRRFDTMTISPPSMEITELQMTVVGVGIMNSGNSPVTFYLDIQGYAFPFSLDPGEAHDYRIPGNSASLYITTEGGETDQYVLHRGNRYHLMYNDGAGKWEVVGDR